VKLRLEDLHRAGYEVSKWIVAPLVQHCHALTAGPGIAMADWIVLVALAIIVPPISRASPTICTVSPWRSYLASMFRVEDIGCCPSSCMSACWVRYCSLCI
jgi:hypothetical protein